MKKFISFVSFVLFVSIIVTILPLSALAFDQDDLASFYTPDDSHYNIGKETAEKEAVRTFSEEIPCDDINEQYHSQLLIQNAEEVSTSVYSLSEANIPDGIYAFKNTGNADGWMAVEQEKDSAGHHIQRYSFGEVSPAESFTRSGLFKVTQVGDTGRFIIRSMLNNKLSFGYESEGIFTKEISPEDGEVAPENTYYIDYDQGYGGYTIRPYNSMQYVSIDNSQASESSENLILTSKGLGSVWSMERVVGNDQWGGTLYFTSNANNNLVVGTTTPIRVVTWSSVIGENEPSVSVNSEFIEDNSDIWDSETSTLNIHPVEVGDVNVTLALNNDEGVAATKSMTLTSETLVPDGLCIIRNRKVGSCIRLDTDAAPDYEAGTILEAGALTFTDSDKWYLMHYYDGYYVIMSALTGCAMTIPLNKANTANATIIQDYATYYIDQLWKIDLSSSGNYILRPQTAESYPTDWCMSLDSVALSQPVCQQAYVNDSNYKDEWIIKHLNYSINLNVVYDEMYNETYSGASSRIYDQLMVLKACYLINFGITINFDQPTMITSYGDQCNNIQNGKCTCVEDSQCDDSIVSNLKQYHHTNMTNILLRRPLPDTTESFSVVYTGYKTCLESYHNPNRDLYGVAYKYRGLIGVSNFLGVIQETKTLVHELGHMYGVIDHYDTEKDDGDNVKTTEELNEGLSEALYDDNCIYGLNKEAAAETLTICKGCRQTIEYNVSDYNHN